MCNRTRQRRVHLIPWLLKNYTKIRHRYRCSRSNENWSRGSFIPNAFVDFQCTNTADRRHSFDRWVTLRQQWFRFNNQSMVICFSLSFVRSFVLVSPMLSLPMSGVTLDNARIFHRLRSFCPYRTGHVNVFRRVKMLEHANDIGKSPSLLPIEYLYLWFEKKTKFTATFGK